MKDQQTEKWFCTGVLATPEEVETMQEAYAIPLMVIADRIPRPEKTVHAIALAHGLPEIRGFYGCDFRDGEFIREQDANVGEPDSWED